MLLLHPLGQHRPAGTSCRSAFLHQHISAVCWRVGGRAGGGVGGFSLPSPLLGDVNGHYAPRRPTAVHYPVLGAGRGGRAGLGCLGAPASPAAGGFGQRCQCWLSTREFLSWDSQPGCSLLCRQGAQPVPRCSGRARAGQHPAAGSSSAPLQPFLPSPACIPAHGAASSASERQTGGEKLLKTTKHRLRLLFLASPCTRCCELVPF